MNNSYNFENEYQTINMTKIWNIFLYRKRLILICFSVILVLCTLITVICPKIYLSEAKILINKNSSTYLSDINPFALSEQKSEGLMKLVSQDNLNNEIEIIKSALVLDKVIKENNLKYKRGPKAGKYLEVRDFLKRNFSIENPKETKILKISYKSKDPVLSYKVVQSVINNYREIYENINLGKATKDKDFLLKSYKKARETVERKITKLKEFKTNAISIPASDENSLNLLLSLHDKRIRKDASSASGLSVESKKLESEVDLEMENLKNLKAKYEWSSQVESMSRNATNSTILEEPKISDISQYAEPKPLFNLILALVISTIISYLIILTKEKTDKKLSFIDLEEDFILINNKASLPEIKAELILTITDNPGIISLVNKEFSGYFTRFIEQNISHNTIINSSSIQSEMDELIKVINSSDSLIFLGQIGSSNRKIYNNLKNLAKKSNKQIIGEFILSPNKKRTENNFRF